MISYHFILSIYRTSLHPKNLLPGVKPLTKSQLFKKNRIVL